MSFVPIAFYPGFGVAEQRYQGEKIKGLEIKNKGL